MKYLLSLFFALFLLGASVEDARKANEAYENGNYEEAVALYKKAIQANSENAKLYFNLGNALAKSGATDEAIQYFEQYKQMTDNPAEKAKADYNIGNIYTQAKKWDQAIQYYKQAMRKQAGDIDAKHNYELALNQKQQQNKNQQNNQNKDQKDQQKKKNQQQSDQQQQQDQQQNQDQNKQQNQQQQQQNQQEGQQKQKPQPSKISKAEAENILKALEQQEKELLKEFKKKKTESSNKTHEKDW
ncbi:MAG: tetratricopeptide repeat protein [Balneolaceae bacterium]|nr:tetratricopeptide repeat protein [Balneolaceae bacterium]